MRPAKAASGFSKSGRLASRSYPSRLEPADSPLLGLLRLTERRPPQSAFRYLAIRAPSVSFFIRTIIVPT